MIKKTFRLLRRGYLDVVRPHRFGNGTLRRGDLNYFLDFTTIGMADKYEMTRDPAGIVQMRHHFDHVGIGGHYYSPVKLAHYVLGCSNDIHYGRGDRHALLRDAVSHGEFLTQMAQNEESLGTFWRTPTSNPRYELPIGYVSGIAQGVAISALVRLTRLTGDKRFLDTAMSATRMFEVPVAAGGILFNSNFGPVYEEYPCDPPSHVVNGFIFALFGLRDLADETQNCRIEELYAVGIASLKAMIPSWIINRWSMYDLRYLYGSKYANLATRHYQYLHVDQMRALAWLESSETFARAAQELENNASSVSMALKVYLNKSRVHIK